MLSSYIFSEEYYFFKLDIFICVYVGVNFCREKIEFELIQEPIVEETRRVKSQGIRLSD